VRCSRRRTTATIEGLLDGTHTGQEVVARTPNSVDGLLTPHGKALFTHPTGGLAAALRVTDGVCTGWTPQAPVRLYYARATSRP